MKIKLIPTSHPELDPIEIDKDIFIIGRLEDPFDSLDTEITADLSRQHAKIFTENDHICIVDLESLNGTTLNDLTLGTKPLPLNDGDIIEFAKHLAYKIELEATAPKASQLENLQQEINLILEPVNNASGLDILVISGFPFLISKETGVFASLPKDFASETSRISRRHAYVVQENNEFKVIDMSSTNGTFVNSKQIDEVEPFILKNGDIISFAGDFFTYIVKLYTANQTETNVTVLNSEQHDIENITISGEVEPKTTFVNEPSPFLDILCDDPGQQPDPKVSTADKNKDEREKHASVVTSFWQRSSSALANITSSKSTKKLILIFLALILVCIALVIAYQFLGKTRVEKTIRDLDKYTGTMTTPNKSADTDDSALTKVSTAKILTNIVPGWLTKLEQGQYSDAQKLLENTRQSHLIHPEIVSSMDILQWVSNIHQYKATRNKNKGLVIFKDESNINLLFATWNKNQKQNRQTLEMVANNVPDFKPFYEQVQSDFRSLEYDRDIYLQAIKSFKANMQNHLKNDQNQELKKTVTQFETKYTAITGFDNIKLDINHYIKLNDAITKKDVKGIVTLQKAYEFKTPLFIQYNQQTLAERLPSKRFLEQYSKAITAWQNGDDKTAINSLLPLLETDWGSSAQIKLERYQAVLGEFSALNNVKEKSEYGQSLFKFHALLKSPEDNYFLNLIKDDFLEKKQVALKKAGKQFDQALFSWKKYTSSNNTKGLLRLENHETDSYEAQAEKLSAASKNIHNSLLIYEYLHEDVPNNIKQLSLKIKKELKKQRKWLVDLELILQPVTQQEKINR